MFTVDVCDGEDVVNIAFARELERELNVANLQMELLTKSHFQLREGRLELKQRIKRLEEAGDAILNANNDDEEYEAIKHWNKTKEAKPLAIIFVTPRK
jgi:hypothetical protein